ncbi:hypothetical protein SynSYN20_00750 [Synechococcus sp. SYN20]|nr:hypothetical protein SynSYN20_00750 [Synechococcus sp. SYN20]
MINDLSVALGFSKYFYILKVLGGSNVSTRKSFEVLNAVLRSIC